MATNNDIKYISFTFENEEKSNITPNDVEVEITALDQYKVAEYKFNSSIDTLPTFNSEFTYEYTDVDNGDGTTTRTIISDNLPSSISFAFKTGLVSLSYLNTSNLTDMSSMFNTCRDLTSIDLSNFDTSNVTNMQSMFESCSNLTELNVSNFNTSNVTDMYGMFYECQSLTQLNISNFDTSNVTNMTSMLEGCTSLVLISMRNSDYNSVNKVITQLPTRTSNSLGTLIIVGVDDTSQVDITTAESKFWSIRSNASSISLNNKSIQRLFFGNKKIIHIFVGRKKIR